jgi:hypothetical protein
MEYIGIVCAPRLIPLHIVQTQTVFEIVSTEGSRSWNKQSQFKFL